MRAETKGDSPSVSLMTTQADSRAGGRESPPADFRFHTGHTWVRLLNVDMAFVGTTDFAVNFAGRLKGISLPHEFHHVRVGETAWTLLSENGRKLVQVAPLEGRVLVANSDLTEDLGKLNESPFGNGWFFCVQSPTIPFQIASLLSQRADRVWLDHTRQTMASVLGSSSRVPFREGEWNLAFGDEFSDEEWESLRHRLFPACRRHILDTEHRN